MTEAEEHVKGLQYYVNIVRRRKSTLIVTFTLAVMIAVAVAVLWPPTYQSKANILIEQQQIPRDFVRTTVDTYAAQQVQVINQRVLTVQNISEIIERYNIFNQAETDEKLPRTVVADMFREKMDLELVSANLVDPKSGRAIEVTIAFSLAYSDPSGSRAQQVVNELVTLFLNENLRDRALQATDTEEFFVAEAERLAAELEHLGQKLADFKSEHEGSLPELSSFNLTSFEKAQRDILDTKRRIRELEGRKLDLASQMLQLSPTAPVVLASGEVVMSDYDRLKSLRSEYRQKSAVYSENHPDVVQLRRKVEELQAELGAGVDVESLRTQLQEQKARLSELRTKYVEDHQEVQQTRRAISMLESEIDAAIESGAEEYEPQADNPAYILLDTQLKAADREIESLEARLVELEERKDEFELRLEAAPNVENEYQTLMRDYNNANVKYQDIRSKQREASVAKNLEERRKGERFTLIEPPPLPTEPISPNRVLILALGPLVGLTLGLGLVFVRSMLAGAVNGVEELSALMGEPPLAAVGYIENVHDRQKRSRLLKFFVGGAFASFLALLVLVHFLYAPLDVLFFSLTGAGG